MKKIITTIIALSLSINLFAQSDHPILPQGGNSINAFIPKGWKKIYQVSGDLNKDKLKDEAIIIESTNPKNLINNDGMGAKILNINPRILLVLFKVGSGYKLQTSNTKFIPKENDEESTCLADPLSETGAMEIKNGSLILSYQYWLSCGSYGVTTTDYTFRYQNNKFQLIGFDSSSFSRSSGEENKTSINFSTFKKSETEGGNSFDEGTNKPKTKWTKIADSKKHLLEEMNADLQEMINNL